VVWPATIFPQPTVHSMLVWVRPGVPSWEATVATATLWGAQVHDFLFTTGHAAGSVAVPGGALNSTAAANGGVETGASLLLEAPASGEVEDCPVCMDRHATARLHGDHATCFPCLQSHAQVRVGGTRWLRLGWFLHRGCSDDPTS
jgi:hypothetical protein